MKEEETQTFDLMSLVLLIKLICLNINLLTAFPEMNNSGGDSAWEAEQQTESQSSKSRINADTLLFFFFVIRNKKLDFPLRQATQALRVQNVFLH